MHGIAFPPDGVLIAALWIGIGLYARCQWNYLARGGPQSPQPKTAKRVTRKEKRPNFATARRIQVRALEGNGGG